MMEGTWEEKKRPMGAYHHDHDRHVEEKKDTCLMSPTEKEREMNL